MVRCRWWPRGGARSGVRTRRGRTDGLAVPPDRPQFLSRLTLAVLFPPRASLLISALHGRAWAIWMKKHPVPPPGCVVEHPRGGLRGCAPGRAGRGAGGRCGRGVSGVAGGSEVQRTDIHLCCNGGVVLRAATPRLPRAEARSSRGVADSWGKFMALSSLFDAACANTSGCRRGRAGATTAGQIRAPSYSRGGVQTFWSAPPSPHRLTISPARCAPPRQTQKDRDRRGNSPIGFIPE